MRWTVVRLIAGKETRDLLRDRRSVMLTFLLPIFLYPVFGLTAWAFASSLFGQSSTVGIVGIDRLAIPAGGHPPLPQLLDESKTKFALGLSDTDKEKESGAGPLEVKAVGDNALELLQAKKIDVVLHVQVDFGAALENGQKPHMKLHFREGDEKSKLAAKRLTGVLRVWEQKVKHARYERVNLQADFDRQFVLDDPQNDNKSPGKKAADELRDTFARVFPFILVMWLVAGAMQPAVDLTAGEKERGTMETLLISPTNRSEIVFGKFFAVTFFSFGSVIWNALWLTVSGIAFESILDHIDPNSSEKHQIINLLGMIGCVLLGLPTAMLFSAICVALGVFARSTKEGQYYLIPLMLLTMPLAFTTMMPGNELTLGTCFVPITGSLLLQQKMLSVNGDPIPWGYFVAVFGSLLVYLGIALSLAVWQFKREAVLFRETGAKSGKGLFAKLFRKG